MNQALQDAAQRQLTELQKRAGERRKEGEEERLRLREKVSAKEREMVAIQAAAEAESEHIVGLKKRMALYQQLLLKGITTVQEKIERENEYHNSIAQLNTHRINIARVKGELLQFEDELARSESQEKQSITDIQQQKVTLQQQVINASAVVESRVVAPLDGVVASMSILEGQRVTAGAVAAVVVPENARPFVEMWIPPCAAGGESGSACFMRVASLPWEWFGKVSGTVAAVSESPEALTGNNRRFALIAPDVGTRALPAGVDVEADILTTHRRIWEWLFLPLKQSINRMTAES